MNVFRQESGSLDLAEVPAHEQALQGAMNLAKQAAAGDRFSPAQLQEAAGPLQVLVLSKLLHALSACMLNTLKRSELTRLLCTHD